MLYQFRTACTMKEYNRKKWWIDSGYIKMLEFTAESLNDALCKYREFIDSKYYITISKTGLKNKRPMYIDCNGEPRQVGYVITAQADFQDEAGTWKKQYIDLWVRVSVMEYVDFTELV